MRDHEFFRVDDRISEEQDIDIDDARTFFLETPAAHLPLQIKDSGQQLPWHLLGAEFNGAIQEPRLSGESYRLGLVERRYGLDAAQCSETCNGDIQVGGTIIKVRAEREVDVFVHGNSFPILAFAFQNKMLKFRLGNSGLGAVAQMVNYLSYFLAPRTGSNINASCRWSRFS
jgi:hypothetical protein